MRFVLLAFVMTVAFAFGFRLDGVWPPEPVRQHLHDLTERALEPGRRALAQFERLGPASADDQETLITPEATARSQIPIGLAAQRAPKPPDPPRCS